MKNSAVIVVNLLKRGQSFDLEVPLDISANELCYAISQMFFPDQQGKINQFYLKTERPVALLRGERTLREYDIRDGSVINITR